ncbi:multidrug resistance-associated protein 1 [Elysia marginata]|uniref:ABC-type glutathione-S-conjugate transporter n=1 Tax=Elysia marginata TaxID=1093978 RepID=A0AAV4IIB4_9GAST|nr:multidrug resistance-associated protein 1 [Elysia marginata]
MGGFMATVHQLLPVDNTGLGPLWLPLGGSPSLLYLSTRASCHSIRAFLQYSVADEIGLYSFCITLIKFLVPSLRKITLVCIASVLTTVDTVSAVSSRTDHFVKADVFAPAILTATLLLSMAFLMIERRKRLVTSGVQFMFWLLLCVSRVVPFYTSIELKEYEDDQFSFYVSIIELGLFLTIFLLHFFAEKPFRSYTLSQIPCQELAASFPSRLTYWWLNWLMQTGYKNTLTETSMPDLRPAEKSQHVVVRFLPRWMAALQKAREEQRAKSDVFNGISNYGVHKVSSSRTDTSDERTPLLSAAKSTTVNSKGEASTNGSLYHEQREPECSTTRAKMKRPSLAWTLFRTFWPDILLAHIFKLPYDLLIICNPLLLGQLVDYVEEENTAVWKGYVFAVGLFVSMMLQTVFLQRVFHGSLSLGLRMRSALISSIFRKALTVDNMSKSESTVGQVVNLMSVDAEHIENVMNYGWALWSSTLQICLSLYLLYTTVGFLLLLIPANGVATTILGNYETQIMEYKDLRMKILNEMLSGIKIVKLFAWEKSFEQRILAVRELELKKLLYSGYVMTVINFSWTGAPFLTSMITYLTYVYISEDHYLDPRTAFVAISLFDVLRFSMNFLPSVVTDMVKAVISVRRIGNFLRQDDLDTDSVSHDSNSTYVITVRNGSFRWQSEVKPVLNKLNLSVEDESLVAVVGPVGSGKSSLISALLGEMDKLGGTVNVRVRVLVTHGVQYLPLTDHVVVMEDGRVTESGHYAKLLTHNGPFARLITNYLIEQDHDKEVDDPAFQALKQEMLKKLSETEEDEEKSRPDDGSSSEIFRRLSRSVSQISETTQDLTQEKKEKLQRQNHPANIIEEEKVEVGMVNFRVFKRYLQSVGYLFGLLIVGSFCCYGALDTGGHIFLSSWTDDPDLANFTLWPANSSERTQANNFYIGIYGLFGALQTVCIIIFSIYESRRLVAASRDLHASMLRSVVRAPMSFFDTTPAGRLINRFSKDMEEMDQMLPMTFVMWIDSLTQMIFAFITISYSTPIFLVFILPVGIIYLYTQRYFVTTSRQLKRLSSKTRSPIFNHFTESLTGASVIRAFGEQRRFELESEAKVDLNTGFRFYNNSVNRWLGVRLETLGNVVILLAAGIAVATRDQISGGIMGLSITYALNITENLNWLVRMTSDLETQIVSVERIVEYTQIESEADWDNPVVKSSPGWPKQGGIKMDKLCLRYREGLDLVLRHISFEVQPGEKVGIVGRTGAGKSSLTLALFRLVEAASGKISIDGVDISELGLHDLRSKITILPQDPVMFAGTLRDNLDPFSEFDDAAVWRSLEHAHLKKFVDGLTEGLDHMCGEGGENLSVGQRQLVCLARALLHKTKILVLDEATAAVDMETDELIQETIRTEFSDCTILTIAHRLNTVMDYDRILVLDHGEVREFDSPAALLANPAGLFYDMAKAASIPL